MTQYISILYIIVCLLLGGLTHSIHSITSDSIELIARVNIQPSLQSIPVEDTVSFALGKQYETNIVIGRIIVDSSRGFELIFSSKNKGNLVRMDENESYVSRPASSDKINYYITLVEDNSGRLGTTLPDFLERSNLSLETNQVIRFNTDVIARTVDKIFIVYMSTPSKPGLTPGVYKDDISVSIADIN